MKLLRLTLSNFKGCKSFTLDAQGESIRVFGDNETGKTTLFDAFNWLLFDKDSQNKSDFDIKTLDKNNNVIHGLEHSVEATISIDGKRTTLRKVYAEKWTKKRGSAKQEFTGHTTDYFVNDVPKKMGEYKDFVKGIIDENAFKLLTSPTYFNEQLKKEKRREILFEICGDVTDQEVIASDKNLAKLPDILGDRSLDEHKSMIASRRRKINDELEKLPVRIDEINHNLPDITGLNESEIDAELMYLKQAIQDKESEINRIRSGGEVAEKQKKLREIEGDLLHIQNNFQSDTLDKVSEKRQELSQLKADAENIRFKVTKAASKISFNNEVITNRQGEAKHLRQEWHGVNNEVFQSHHDENCPTCGQSLPEDQIKGAHEKALADFNHRKAERLEGITVRGKVATSEINRLKEENIGLTNDIEKLEQELAAKEKELKQIESELNQLQGNVKNIETDPLYIRKKQEVGVVQQLIEALHSSLQTSIDAVQSEIIKFRAEVSQLEADKAKIIQVSQSEIRVNELKEQERKLAAEFEKLEEQIYLIEEFTRSKVNYLEEKISSKFKYARFKLFEEQVNGGLKDECETLYKGVPYSSGLNNAARINVGLDIINTLSEHYGFTAPIFVDNSESVTSFIETNAQLINLVVSEKDKKLRVEHADQKVKEAV